MATGKRVPVWMEEEDTSGQPTPLRVHISALLTLADGTRRAVLAGLALNGARLTGVVGVQVGQTVVVQWSHHHALGTISWVDGQDCGVDFARPLPVADLLETRALERDLPPELKREMLRRNADAFVNGRVRL